MRVKRIVYDEREDISGKPKGGKKKGLHAATHAIDKFCSRDALSRVDDRRRVRYRGVAVGCLIPVKQPRKFSGPVSRLLRS